MDTMWQARHSSVTAGGWREWLATGVALLARDVVSAIDRCTVWQDRVRQRRHLGHLDARALSDIGLSRADVVAETSKPFWVR